MLKDEEEKPTLANMKKIKTYSADRIYEAYSKIQSLNEQETLFSSEKCRTCWAKLFCSGDCHADAYFSNGSIEKPNELSCILQKKRIECAIMIQALMADKSIIS